MDAKYVEIDLHNDEEYKKMFDYICTQRALDPVDVRSKLKISGKVTLDSINKLCASQELKLTIDYKAKTMMVVYYPAKVITPQDEGANEDTTSNDKPADSQPKEEEKTVEFESVKNKEEEDTKEDPKPQEKTPVTNQDEEEDDDPF